MDERTSPPTAALRSRRDLTGLVLAVLVLAMLAPGWCVQPSAALDGVVPGVHFATQEYDFGTVDQGDRVTADFSFENRGTVLLTLSGPIVACDCAAEILGPSDVPPGGHGTVRFSCDTTRMFGDQERTATIHVSDVDRQSTMLRMRGRVTLDVVVQPDRLYLGTVVRGSRRPRALALRTGRDRRVVRGVRTAGPHLAVGVEKGAASVFVAVSEDAPLGAFSQDVLIETGSARFPVLRIPVAGVVVEAVAPSLW